MEWDAGGANAPPALPVPARRAEAQVFGCEENISHLIYDLAMTAEQPGAGIHALVMSPDDDVAVALVDLAAGARVGLGGAAPRDELLTVEAIPRGHKLAVHEIPAAASVRKYGATIGLATQPIARGAHVHVHNVESARLRGDA
jgi:altronate dehydratase small subunit